MFYFLLAWRLAIDLSFLSVLLSQNERICGTCHIFALTGSDLIALITWFKIGDCHSFVFSLVWILVIWRTLLNDFRPVGPLTVIFLWKITSALFIPNINFCQIRVSSWWDKSRELAHEWYCLWLRDIGHEFSLYMTMNLRYIGWS